MPGKAIQEQFGQRVIEAFASFARADIRPVDVLEREEFAHVSDRALRRALAQVLYGVRWIYKLGLALLTRDEERGAHVRAQIVDYASVCEALLNYCVGHAIRRGHVSGTAYLWGDPDSKLKPLRWTHGVADNRLLARQSLWWLIRVSKEFRIVDANLAVDLDWLRVERNSVHIRQRATVGAQAFLNQSKKAFEVVSQTIGQTKAWKATHL